MKVFRSITIRSALAAEAGETQSYRVANDCVLRGVVLSIGQGGSGPAIYAVLQASSSGSTTNFASGTSEEQLAQLWINENSNAIFVPLQLPLKSGGVLYHHAAVGALVSGVPTLYFRTTFQLEE